MLKAVKTFLKEQKWDYSKNEKSNVFVFGISGENGSFQCIIDVNEDSKQLMIYTYCGSNCPKSKFSDMLRLLNYLNYKIILGNFEMDNEVGEIRFRTSIDYTHLKPTPNIVESLAMPNIVAMDMHLPIIMGIIHGGYTLKKAMEYTKEFQ